MIKTLHLIYKPIISLLIVIPFVFNASSFAQSRTWYQDADNDGWGNAFVSMTSATKPGGYVLNNEDCDDARANKTGWKSLKDTGFYAQFYPPSYDMDIDGLGTPYLFYSDGNHNNRATVRRFINNEWQIVGTEGFSSDILGQGSIAIDGKGVPYIGYRDEVSTKAIVMKFDKDSNNWVNVGSPGFSGQYYIAAPSIVINTNGVPYFAFNDAPNLDRLHVMTYDGNNWITMGDPNYSSITGKSAIGVDRLGKVYIAYCDNWNTKKVVVKTFNGNDWVTQVLFTEGRSISLAIDTSGNLADDAPYICYANTKGKIVVQKYNTLLAKWDRVGPDGFSNDVIGKSSITIDPSGIPFVSFTENGNIVIMKFNGIYWQTVGDTIIAEASTDHPLSIAVDQVHLPHIAYHDSPSQLVIVKSVKPELLIDTTRMVTIAPIDTITSEDTTMIAVTFKAEVTAIDSPVYKWYLNNKEMVGFTADSFVTSWIATDTIFCSVVNYDTCVGPTYSNKLICAPIILGTFDNIYPKTLINLYPIPASNALNISFSDHALQGKTNVRIYDITGRELQNNDYDLKNHNTIAVPLGQIPPGIYFVKATFDNQAIAVQRFVKN